MPQKLDQTRKCIQHVPGDHFVALHADIVELFDGDHCCAALIWFFEFFTNYELGRLTVAEESTSDISIQASIPMIFEEITRLYSVRSITTALSFLRKHGFLYADDKDVGTVRKYSLNYELINEMLKSRTSVSSMAGSTHAILQGSPFCMGTPAKTTTFLQGSGGCIKEEEVRLEEEVYTPPTPSEEQNSEEDLNLEDDIKLFVKNLYRRLGRGKPVFKDRFNGFTNDHEKQLRQEERKRGAGPVRRALIAYVNRSDDWAVEHEWPLYAALKAVKELPATTTPPAASSARVLRPNGAATSPSTPQATDAPQRAQTAPTVFALQELGAVSQWNAGVVNAPRAEGLSAKEKATLAKILREEPDLGEKFGDLVARVEKIWTAMHADWREDSGWLSFDGVVLNGKWAGVLRGKYDYLMRPRGENGGSKKRKSVSDELIESLQKEIGAK